MNANLASVFLSIVVGASLIFVNHDSLTRRSPEKPYMQRSEAPSQEQSDPKTLQRSRSLIIRLPPPPEIKSTRVELKTQPVKTDERIIRSMNLQPLKPVKIGRSLFFSSTRSNPTKPLSPSRMLGKLNKSKPPAKIEETVLNISAPKQLSPDITSGGRSLLRLLETGRGPVVTVDWPNQLAMRKKLYTFLTGCYEMQTSVYVEKIGLYRHEDRAGKKWSINKDAISSFIRRPSGGLAKKEQQIVSAIRSKHQLWSGIPVRVFPRSVDAALLGGLRSIIGGRYFSSKSISAKYFIEGNSVGLREIRSDQTIVDGSFILPKSRRCT